MGIDDGPGHVSPPRRAIGPDLAAGLAPLAAVAGAAWASLGLSALYLVLALALYAAHAGLILAAAPAALPGRGLGPANRVTLLRSAFVLPVAALAGVPGLTSEAAVWVAIAFATVSLLLDGVDGAVARRTGTSTRFGARYDMELDAFLMLALSVLVWQSGRTGAWVVLIGTLRYLFVAGGWLAPALRAELPPSLRRKVVCVVQGVGLLVALAPVIPAALAPVAAGVALALLVGSFGADVRWLLRHGRGRDADPSRGT